jgi:hypothetical protein
MGRRPGFGPATPRSRPTPGCAGGNENARWDPAGAFRNDLTDRWPELRRPGPARPGRRRRPPAGQLACPAGDHGQVRAAVLVEGLSDRAAVEALARRRGRDLAAEGVLVVPMGGATNIGRFLDRYGPTGLDVGLAGLYDAAEEGFVRRALERAGLGADPAAAGFFACTADLEDELIRALGAAAVERVVEAAGELPSFRRFQRQPAQRGQRVDAQLHRFLGTRSGRKARYGRLLVDELEETRVPLPLDRVLAVRAPPRRTTSAGAPPRPPRGTGPDRRG